MTLSVFLSKVSSNLENIAFLEVIYVIPFISGGGPTESFRSGHTSMTFNSFIPFLFRGIWPDFRGLLLGRRDRLHLMARDLVLWQGLPRFTWRERGKIPKAVSDRASNETTKPKIRQKCRLSHCPGSKNSETQLEPIFSQIVAPFVSGRLAIRGTENRFLLRRCQGDAEPKGIVAIARPVPDPIGRAAAGGRHTPGTPVNHAVDS